MPEYIYIYIYIYFFFQIQDADMNIVEIVSAVWPAFLVHGSPTHIDLDQFNVCMSRLSPLADYGKVAAQPIGA